MAGGVKRRRFTLDEYRRMGETGILRTDDRVELIDGEVVEMSAPGGPHAATVARFQRVLGKRLGRRAVIRSQDPFPLPAHQAEPRPDLLVLAPRADAYAGRVPEPADVWLLIEVSDRSLFYDRGTKLRLYARAGVVEAWLASTEARRLEIHRGRGRSRYRSVRLPRDDETFAPAAWPDLTLTLRDLFG